MSEFLAGALIGELLLLIIMVMAYNSSIIIAIKYDFRRSLKKNYKSILTSILVAGFLGGVYGLFDKPDGSDGPCRSFGNSKAESC